MQSTQPMQSSVAIDEVTRIRERTLLQRILTNQAFWVTITVALICVGTGYKEPNFLTLARIAACPVLVVLLHEGNYDLALYLFVAAGITDASWSRGPKNEWDICAGVLLVEEAGGRCVNLDDEPFTFNRPKTLVNGFIADNGRLHEDLIALLAPHRHTARKK